MPYKYLDHTADIGIEVEAADFNSTLVESIYALLELIFGVSFRDFNIENEIEKVEVISNDKESLIVDLLNEVLFLIDSRNVIPLKPEIILHSNFKAELIYQPYKFDLESLPINLYVKAVTFHQLELIENNGKVKIKFYLDI